jgi:hypothetical protein
MNLLTRGSAQVDPARYGDPVAEKAQWHPIKSGGSNFCTRKLKVIEYQRAEFRPTVGAFLFYIVFIVMGMGALIVFPAADFFDSDLSDSLAFFIPIIVGGVFVVVGTLGVINGTTPIVFDRLGGYFYRGRKNPLHVADKTGLKNFVEIGRIHALQIVSEYCRSDKSSYYSYELNLVIDDGERINVIDHGNLTRIRGDAATLATFLGVSVWDAA